MELTRPSTLLATKSNVKPIGNRIHEATAEDFIEVANLLIEYATAIEALQLATSPNPFYGRYTSLALLQAAYPTGELNSWAVIDAGIGITPQIAIWDNLGLNWEISGYESNTIEVTNYAALPAPGTIDKWYVTIDTNYLYRWYNSRYNLIGAPNYLKESYYDSFKFVSGYEDDLTDLILEQAFQLVKTTGGLYFFVSDILNNESLVGSRIYINAVSLFFNFAEPDIETISFKAWQLTIPIESFIVNNQYVFNFWLKDYSILESQLSVVAKTGEYSDLIGAPNYTKESKSFLGGETQWVLTQVPSADFPHRIYSGSVDGGGLILLEENIDYTLVGNVITYLSPVLPIENHEKHIIHYNLPGDSSIYISPNNDVKLRNADVYEPVNTSAYYKNGIIFNSRNLQLMIATDLHGDVNAVNNIITMMNEFATIDGGLNLGDTCENTWEDDFSFVDPLMTIGKPFLIAIGNHDEGLGYTVANTGSTAAAYARFVQPYEATIGGTHAGKSYYYKDWVGYKIRTIVLYEYDDNDDLNVGDPLLYRVAKTTRVWSQAQIDWLIATLNSTPSDYSVMIAMHQTVVDQLTWIEGKFTDINHIVPGDSSSFSDEALIPDIINAWKNGASLVNTYPFTGEAAYKADISVNANFTARGPGEFICYLAGHAHVDAIGTVPAYVDQLQIILTCSTSDANRNKYGDLQRQVGRRSEDCFNVISFDTFNKTVKIVRIGSQITFDMRKRDYIEIPY